MKRRGVGCAVLALPMVWAASDLTMAQRIPPDPSLAPPVVRRRMEQLNELHESIKKSLNLNDKQKNAIDKIFEEYLKTIARIDPRLPIKFPPGEEPPPEVRQVQKNVAKLTDQPVDLLERLEAELNDDQRKKLARLVGRWETIFVRSVGEGPLRLVGRAVKDPNLDVSDQKREALREIVKQAIESVGFGRPDEATLSRAVGDARAKIIKQLTPEQKAHFIETLNILQKQRALELKRYKWLRDRKPIIIKP